MAAPSIQDIKNLHDVARLLEEHPEWRAALRRLVLTDDLLALPEQVTRLTGQVAALVDVQTRTDARATALVEAQAQTERRLAELAEAQRRTEQQIAALAEAQRRTDEQITALATRVDELAAAQTRTETQLAAVTDVVQGLSEEVGALKGEMLELRYGVRGIPPVGRLLRRSQVLSLGEVYDLLDDAVERGALSEEERDTIAEADLIVRGKDRKTGTDMYLVIEVSWRVGPSDIERAAERAALLAKLGTATLPWVAGWEITREAREQALIQGVWQFIDGTVVPPAS